MAKKRVKKSKSKKPSSRNQKDKTSLIVKNLLTFGILFILSLGLYNFVSDGFISDLLFITSLITGFVLIALLISYLVLLFVRIFNKK